MNEAPPVPPPYTITHESIAIIWKGMPYVVQKNAVHFKALRHAIMAEDWDAVSKNLTPTKSLKEWAKGKFTLNEAEDTFYFENKPLPRDLNRRIIAMATEGKDPQAMLNFWERLQRNPSYRSVQQLWPFLNHQGIALTQDGCFLAYKGVKSDYRDAHTGRFDNSPGSVNEMPRNQISDDPKEACHEGFHVGALEYARSFSERVVICEVDPEHVVCVPYDSSAQKMRVCKYVVRGNHNGTHLPSTVYIPDEYDASNDEQPSYVDGEAHVVIRLNAPEDSPEAGDDAYDSDTEDDDEEDSLAGDYNQELIQPDDYVSPVEEAPTGAHDVPKPKKKKPKGVSAKRLAAMDLPQLMEVSIGVLRKYAGKNLKILGASRIPGGKTALVAKILEVRRVEEPEEA